jgi:EAL domain-containing protein (putative c-di-GMP-specific phosphodiesterase class I)
MARGLMHWVLDKALDQLVAWRRVGLRIQLSVNVSPANLEDDDFADHVLGALDAANLPPTALELEITESALLNETGPSLRQLRALSDMGICIAIDDFGTGYSSLSYLQRLPADVIKIDQSFVLGLSQGGADEHRLCTLIAAMIGLSHDLGYRVVAEGIETQEVADLLLSLKCDEVQGYWFARRIQGMVCPACMDPHAPMEQGGRHPSDHLRLTRSRHSK